MDSDSYPLIFWDLYRELEYIKARFDTSYLSPSNIYNIPLLNKMVIGLMKYENATKKTSSVFYEGLKKSKDVKNVS